MLKGYVYSTKELTPLKSALDVGNQGWPELGQWWYKGIGENWSMHLKRRDYRFNEMLRQQPLASLALRWENGTISSYDRLGKGPTLTEANPWLRDEAERIERILDVSERDSVIEGLPRSPRKHASGSAKNSLPVPSPCKRLANDLDHRCIVSLERRPCRLDVLALSASLSS